MQIPAPLARWLVPLYERHGRQLPAIATAIFVVLTARAAADLLWALIPAPEDAQWKAPPVSAAAATQRGSGSTDINAILGARLFGQYSASANPTQAALLDAPETRLNLTLMGILAGSRDSDSRALIGTGSGVEEPYAVGDDVSRGVQLQAVFPDRVILKRDTGLETLRLEKDRPSSDAAAHAPPSVAEAEPPAGAAPNLAQVRDQVLKDPAKASEYIRVQPANVGGQLKGYRIYPGKDRAIFSSAGLRPGDLVTSVNGVELNDAGRALQLLGDLSQASQVTLTVERGGQPQTINVSLN